MPRGDLFPEIGPLETGYMPLSGGHVMYWEQVGNPRGQPVLFLHGGPGAGAGAVHRRFFDPQFWRIIIFDQRGAGRSRPLGLLAHNTTPDLVSDIEALRRHLGIERWLLFGGSWGSTLALAYAQAAPERVLGCVLRGVFLGRPRNAPICWPATCAG
jgi:proline iminopeptidase